MQRLGIQKAFAALLTAGGTLGVQLGFLSETIAPELAASISTLLTALVVYLVPNGAGAGPSPPERPPPEDPPARRATDRRTPPPPVMLLALVLLPLLGACVAPQVETPADRLAVVTAGLSAAADTLTARVEAGALPVAEARRIYAWLDEAHAVIGQAIDALEAGARGRAEQQLALALALLTRIEAALAPGVPT